MRKPRVLFSVAHQKAQHDVMVHPELNCERSRHKGQREGGLLKSKKILTHLVYPSKVCTVMICLSSFFAIVVRTPRYMVVLETSFHTHVYTCIPYKSIVKICHCDLCSKIGSHISFSQLFVLSSSFEK